MIKTQGLVDSARTNAWLGYWRALLQRPEMGFARLADVSADWTEISRRAEGLKAVQHLVVLGTGGSSLGTQVIVQAIPARRSVEIDFLESPDPVLWARVRPKLSPSSHFLIVSKSGSTLETIVWIEKLATEGFLNARNSTLITSPGNGPMHQWAEREQIARLGIPADVGGRYSVLSAAGMLPAAILGLEPERFRVGAAWALAHPEVAATMAEAAWESWSRGEWITQLWSFSVGLHAFGEWWQQLWAESLAKKTGRNGAGAPRASSPMGCTGPRDQHSVLQQLIEGARDKFVFVTRVASHETDTERFQASLMNGSLIAGREISLGKILSVEAQAFERSLKDSKIQSLSLMAEDLSESSLAALFMTWQMTVAMLGERMGIDPFNQPGVELGKKHAAQLLNA